MAQPFATVGCAIEAYPYEGGSVYIQGGQIKSVTVSKTLRGGGNGNFSIELAPGGPNGPESSPDWTEIITPGSHVLIGMSRGSDSAIVLDGVATVTAEDQMWSTRDQGSSAMRRPTINGSDFAWFFNTQNWYSLAMYGLAGGTGLGSQLGYLPSSLVETMSQGLRGDGTPVKVGQAWFNIMAGPSGMLHETFIPWGGDGTRVPFGELISQNMEQYPNVYIPLTEQFLGLESWMAKFMDIFPWPWYEFFVTTAPSGVYKFVSQNNPNANVSVYGTTFTMRDFPNAAPTGPQLVARVTPIPKFNFTKLNSTGIYIPSSMDTSRWTALPLTVASGYGFYESRVEFTSEEVRNFYMLNPTAYQTTFGDNGANVVPFPFVYLAAADPASVHRYGYQPVNATLRWFYDYLGTASQTAAQTGEGVNIQQTVATLTAALASWWHPLPLMLKGQVAIPLSPSIYIGTRYRYAPFKDGITWDFYVEGVTHHYVFGGQSSTTLTLTRGLPTSVYNDTSAGGLLQSIYTGNARRQYTPGTSGIYQIGLPEGTGQGLQVFSTQENANNLSSQMWNGFAVPQWPST